MNEHMLEFSPTLQGADKWRFRYASDSRLLDIECTPRFGPNAGDLRWVCWRAYKFNRETPADRMGPALIFISEGVWRSEPWPTDLQHVPKGTAFLFKNAPPELVP